jgi:methionyl-tRNA synthetase
MPKKYYVTSPIYYVNGLPHVGSALTTIACDALTRYHRLRGETTWFVTGTDENATKVQQAAEKAGVPTQPFVDRMANAFREAFDHLDIRYDDFIRTTEARHVRAVQEFFRRLRERGYVYLDTYEGWYSVSDETFFRDEEVRDGVAIETGKPVEWVQEANYFFKLSAFQEPLLAHIAAHPEFLQPEFRRNEVLSFIKEGLRDISIARANRGWGIPFPDDDRQVVYVWFDALISYLSATGWPDDPNWETLWPADLHFMGKEIFVRFHATFWPAMLMALGLPLPKQVYAHGFWTLRGIEGKPGKSTGGLPHPTRLSQFLAERSGTAFDIGADAQRYLLCREMNFGLDTEFSVENLLRRYNSDLANDLGNLLNRTINMAVRYFDAVVPETTRHDAEIVALAARVQAEYAQAMQTFRLNEALEAAWKLVARMNKYIDEKAPWTLAKAANAGDTAAKEELATVLYACLEAARIVATLVSPFMARAAETIRLQLGLVSPVAALRWEELAWGGLPAGTRLNAPAPVFPRIQELTIDEATLTRLCSAPEAPAAEREENPVSESETPIPTPPAASSGTPVAPESATPAAEALISIDDFMKVNLRVAEVLAAEPVPNATKLLRLTVQAGEDDTRTILAGLAEFYTPSELVGRQVIIVANLQPRKMRGIESQGMLLAADRDGRPILLHPDQEVPVGTRVR